MLFSDENTDDEEIAPEESPQAVGPSMPLLDDDIEAGPSGSSHACPSATTGRARVEDDTQSGEAV